MATPESESANRVVLRTVWPDEAQDFTPWLAKNLHRLGEKIGEELTIERTEAPSWERRRLDILAKTGDGAKVAIENQYGESDDDHFTRLIEYAANHDAREIVWVAEKFWEFHLRKIAWLNKVMNTNAKIHAVAVRLEPGGDLRPVSSDENAQGYHADFATVDLDKYKPEWAVLKSGELSETDQRRQRFFQQLIAELQSKELPLKPGRRDRHWQHFESGFRGVTYVAIINEKKAFVTLWISLSPKERVPVYDALSEYRAELESEVQGLTFDIINSKYSIGMDRPGSLHSSDSELEKIRQWMVANLIALEKAIQPRLEAVMQKLQEPSP